MAALPGLPTPAHAAPARAPFPPFTAPGACLGQLGLRSVSRGVASGVPPAPRGALGRARGPPPCRGDAALLGPLPGRRLLLVTHGGLRRVARPRRAARGRRTGRTARGRRRRGGRPAHRRRTRSARRRRAVRPRLPKPATRTAGVSPWSTPTARHAPSALPPGPVTGPSSHFPAGRSRAPRRTWNAWRGAGGRGGLPPRGVGAPAVCRWARRPSPVLPVSRSSGTGCAPGEWTGCAGPPRAPAPGGPPAGPPRRRRPALPQGA
ncbi:hypothetical protein STENM327S_03573 [Streptomyces tendae]